MGQNPLVSVILYTPFVTHFVTGTMCVIAAVRCLPSLDQAVTIVPYERIQLGAALRDAVAALLFDRSKLHV